jgi:hypothetical protein
MKLIRELPLKITINKWYLYNLYWTNNPRYNHYFITNENHNFYKYIL